MNISISGRNISISKSQRLLHYRFRIPKNQIAYSRFILESYEGFGIQSTEAGSDVVTWSFPESRKEEVESLLQALLNRSEMQNEQSK